MTITAPPMSTFIVDARTAVSELLRMNCSAPVYTFLPDDVAHLPCLVVGRPSIRESRTAGVSTLTLTVTLLGRRIADEDAQRELDVLGDELFAVLGGTKNIRSQGIALRCTNFVPGTIAVAGQEMPAYLADVVQEIVSC